MIQRSTFHLSRRSVGEGGTNSWHAIAARRRREATAHVLLRDISKILFPNNPVNVPVIK
jgi:hypothetical protein